VAAAALRGGWLRADVVAVPLSDIDPKTSRADLDRLLADLARPAVAAPVTVQTSRGDLVVPPAAIAASLILTADATGTITPRIDERKLRAALAKQLAAIEVQPRDATVRAGDGSVRILASSGGTLVDTAKLSRDLVGVLGRPAPRTVAGALKTVAPKTTTSDLTKLGIKQQISTFTTYFPAGQDRTKNIVLIAKEVDGAVVEPGETFSLNGHTGIRGYAEGYVDAPVISDGRLVNAVGGGNSQFTTTLFNAAYYAGLEDVYHQPHSFYISRYPSVIEATIIYPTVDLKFRNDTPYGVLIDTSWTAGSITVTMWSTKRYDVSTVWGPRRDIVEPVTRHLPDDDECIPTSGTRGFAQDAWRVFKQNGVEVKREKFSWRYDAQARFICG
jgi:vancomycin resistance protein YoaR